MHSVPLDERLTAEGQRREGTVQAEGAPEPQLAMLARLESQVRRRQHCADMGLKAEHIDAARIDVHALREASIDRLADAVEAHLDTHQLATLMGLDACKP